MLHSLRVSANNINSQPLISLQNIPLDFQNAIKNGSTDLIQKLLSNGFLVDNPLPNRELPLHFAVRENQQEIVLALLEKNANSELKDFQGLTAIDHAALMKNDGMLASILGKKIGKDLKEIQEQIKCKGSAAHVNQLKSKIEKIATVNVEKLTPVSKAAYEGNLDQLTHLSMANSVNNFDANGLAPIHYAILSNRNELVNLLIKLGSRVDMLTRDGDSLLHFAALSGSKEMLTKTLELKIDPNHRNSTGTTALHYAGAKDNLAVVELLVKNGANPYFIDNQGMSPLTLIGTSANQRDPLALSKTQVALFTTTALFWLSTTAFTSGLVTSDAAKSTAFLLMIGTSVATTWTEFAVLVTNLNKTWKKVLAWGGMFTIASIPGLNIGFQAWNTYHVARSSFEGLKKCWNNVGYRNWAVARNAVVHSANTANSAFRLYSTIATTYELCLIASYLAKVYAAKQSGDEEAFINAYEEYLNFLKDRYNIGNQSINIRDCADIKPSTLNGLSNVERLCKPELNPQCPEHALMMMSPYFTMDQLRDKGSSLYKKVYRDMMLKEVHPDKVGSSEELKEAAARLAAASDTLKTWLKTNR